MKNPNHKINAKLLELARETIRMYGDKIPVAAQENILNQTISLGMSPYEAKLAGGEFFFKVDADVKKWPKDTPPLEVMWAQSTQPDGSKIWMTFENHTQYASDDAVRFTVEFTQGVASNITKT